MKTPMVRDLESAANALERASEIALRAAAAYPDRGDIVMTGPIEADLHEQVLYVREALATLERAEAAFARAGERRRHAAASSM